MKSINNYLMVEPYLASHKLREVVKSGFAKVEQKSDLVGLKLIHDATIKLSEQSIETVKAGSTIFFKETDLHAGAWAKSTYKLAGTTEEFILVSIAFVVGYEAVK